ncbi:hypothetical protein PR202_ga13444 [Eleusine coracana subsp. coracana]|uniref:Helicase C-terminal domain-containing protein n=1 Tax=Eleusine coracana subsp. coracana TaxID=191504 RepID=A0AAV5CER0_ELECO|nr:hypothetical protein PR202_ga13444 [Eleusine coracana subsp. coracana]
MVGLKFWRDYHSSGKFDLTDLTLITGQERDEIEGAKHSSVTVEMACVSTEYQCAVIDEIQLPFLLCKFSYIQKRIESAGKHLCSVVYGSLPPETRTKQATMFNDDSSDLSVLVASDAIGMGLNLNISRIIFSTMKKFDGFCFRELTVSEIKQIAGRAGRYGSKFPIGEVTCLDAQDLPLLHLSLNSPSPIIEERFLEKAKLSPDYFISDGEDMLKVAAIVDDMSLGLYDKYLFCLSPVDLRDDISVQGLVQASFAETYAKKGIVRLKEIFTPGTLVVPKTHNQLQELESVHKVLELYVWLSFRLEDSFPDREVAASQKSICSMWVLSSI